MIKLSRIVSLITAAALVMSLHIPAMAAENGTDTTDTLVINSVRVDGNTVTVQGESDSDVVAALVNPGSTEADVKANPFLGAVSGFDYFETNKQGEFTITFYKEGLSGDYHMRVANSTSNVYFALDGSKAEKNIYVSPTGNDEADGSIDTPLKTLDAAKLKVREHNPALEKVTVTLLDGEYDCTNTEFTSEDSGLADNRVKYVAQEGAVFKGTKKIPYSSFKKVTDADVLSKLDTDAAKNVLCVKLDENGFTKDDINFLADYQAGKSVSPLSIYVDSKRQMLSRYPNSGFMRIDDVIQEGGNSRHNVNPHLGAVFSQYDSHIKKWQTAENAYGVGYFGAEYSSEWAKIKSVSEENHTITFDDWTVYGVKKNYRWYITNLIEEMDVPGEWYIDIDNMLLYYYPSEDFNENSKFEIAVNSNPVMTINGASYIDFSGFNITETAGMGVVINEGDNISIKDFDISQTKSYGIMASGNNITIDGCKIHNTHDTGIYLSKGGNRNTLTSSGNVISNNYFYKTATDSGSNWHGGIQVGANNVGTVVKNNLFQGINNYSYTYGGNDNKFSYNEIWAANRETGDSCPVYSGRNLSEYGNVISYNYVHECYNPNDMIYANYGVNSGDDWESGTIIENNIIYFGKKNKTSCTGTHSRDNTIRYNISVCAGTGVELVDRYRWIKDIRAVETWSTLSASLNKASGLDIGYAETEIWQAKYPQISTILQDVEDNNGKFMVRDNVVTDNVSVDAPNKIDDSFKQLSTVDRNLDIDDYDIFVDSDNHDFRITAEAMAKYNLDENIINENNFEMSRIGIQGTEEKTYDEFKLTYPYNNSTVDAESVNLSWTAAEYSDKYKVEIATDNSFSNVVYTTDTIYENISVDELLPGTTYYWRVKAKNSSKQVGNEWDTTNGVYSFKTSNGIVSAANSSYEVNDNKVIINADVTNKTQDNVDNSDLMFAFYGENGELQKVKIESCDIASGDNFNRSYEYTDIEAGAQFKMFFWNKSLKPITPIAYPIKKNTFVPAEYEIDTYETQDDSAVFTVTTEAAGMYDVYYYADESSTASSADVKFLNAGGVAGGEAYVTTLDLSSKGGYVFIGRYNITAPDGSGIATITVTPNDGTLSLGKIKAIEAK